jgi:P-type Ca2+ transporter type 2C
MLRSVPLQRLTGLASTEQGLVGPEVVTRRAQYGANLIIEKISSGWLPLLLETVKDPMLWFLLGTSLLFGVVGEYAEAIILLIAMIPFFGMDAFLHRRTQALVEGLSGRLGHQATVIRDGTRQLVTATELVPGDLVIVAANESFPADGLILLADTLQVDESALTGEAYPVRKITLPQLTPNDDEAKVDGIHWGLAGTRVLTGTAHLRIVYTGAETIYGEIVQSAVSGSHERTPLQQAVVNLVTLLVIAAAIVCIILAWVRYSQGHGLLDAILSALTLAVAAIPEEFPVVLTFFLGVGVYRLAKRQALVRRAVVVENIGRVSCICSDKTGTITEGRLRLAHHYAATGISDERLLFIASAASRSESGDPMDLAILEIAGPSTGFEAIASFPFTEDRKRETGIFREADTLIAAAKGAPEVIIKLSTLDAAEIGDWQARTQQLASGGHKVIACAWRALNAMDWPGGEPDRGFTFAGLLAFEDPVRAGVPEALQICQAARIQVVMVTGDHPTTAAAVAKEIGLGTGTPTVITGDDMEHRINTEGGEFLRHVDVIARAVPAQKLALVRSLQTQGEIVAVTGDGVNDVPALQAADIGIAMGERGTRSAREVAAIVLLDDNFRSIVRAIAEGRQLFTNLQLSFQYLLMIHIPLVVTAAMIPMVGYPLLYLPIHIVWLEMIIHPTALLVFQNLPVGDYLSHQVRERYLRFFSIRQWSLIILAGTLITAIVLVSYVRSLGEGFAVEHARAMALVALTFSSAGITASLSKLQGLAPKLVVFCTIGFSLLLVQTPGIAALLHLSPLHWDDWAIAAVGALLVSILPTLPWFRRKA